MEKYKVSGEGHLGSNVDGPLTFLNFELLG